MNNEFNPQQADQALAQVSLSLSLYSKYDTLCVHFDIPDEIIHLR